MKTREELPQWLTDDYLNHVDLIEPYRRGQGNILAADKDCVYLRIDDISLAAVRNAAGLKRVLNAVPKGDILSIAGYTEAGVCETVGMAGEHLDYNYAYLKKEPAAVSLPPETEIRPLTQEHLSYVYEHYLTVPDREYLADRIAYGMLGAFVRGQLRGFIGEHDEGTMGILVVEEAYRRLHLGSCLEAALINQTLASGRVPICQVEIDNTASRGLQEKLGLVHGGRTVYWYF